ncbi:MAG: murein biosynthesis integral membrane protein MurJ, partial [Terriglobia bacterium]
MADRTGKPQGQSIARATLTMSVLTTLSRITGFGRVMAFAFALGLTSTIIPDSFNLANSLPNIIYELLVGGILTSLFIPVFVEYLETEEREEAFRLASALLNIAIVLMTIVTLVGIVAAPWIIKLYTPQLGPGKEQALMTFFLRFFIPQIIFYSVAAVFAGLLNSFKKFGPPAFAPVINNLVVITTFLLFRFVPGFGVTGLAIGTTAGVVCMALVQIPSILRTGLRYSFTISLRHEGVRKIARLSLPLFGYVLTNQVGLWIVAVLATPVKGSYAAYSTAFQTFYQLPHGIFALSIITALFPTLAQQKVHNNLESFRQTLSLGIRLIALTVLPAALGYIALSKPIITLTLEHGMFTANDTRTLAAV